MISDILVKITDSLFNIKSSDFSESCPIGIIDVNNWEWPQGVGMYGLFQCYKKFGNEAYLQRLQSWYDAHLSQELPDRNVNTTAPMLALAFLYEETGREDYKALCMDWAEWVMNDMTRTPEGGIQHRVSGEENHGQLWSDTLFMTVLFLAKMGQLLGNAEYIEEAKKQFLIHIKYLYDKSCGLWFHGWTFDGHHNFAGAHWARGNCWFTICVAELAEIIDFSGSFKAFVTDTLIAQIAALEKYQDASGGWHTLIDDEGSYLEASATAGFGYGILKAVRLGLIDKRFRPVGEKALQYVLNNIDAEGVVQNVSYGTGMGYDLDHYRNIPLCPMTYGQSLAQLILLEAETAPLQHDLNDNLEAYLCRYDEEKSLIYCELPKWNPDLGGGYHSRLDGRVHRLLDTAKFINLVYVLNRRDCMEKAEASITALLQTQDMDKASSTYGLWAYFYEESLRDMLAPDFNMASFTANQLLYVMKKCPHLLKAETVDKLHISLRAAISCLLKRNVSPDYTNISLMTSVTLIVGAEILHDAELLEEGKRRFKQAYEYNMFCGSFSEFNSPDYTVLAITELSRMLYFAEDEDSRRWAAELCKIGWKTILDHYDKEREQLAPPHSRAYDDFLETDLFKRMIYVGTDGKFGEPGQCTSCFDGLPIRFPEAYYDYLVSPKLPRFVQDTFYKENNLRSSDQDTVIVRDLDCPELKSNTYMTKDYSIGSFEKTDLWAQRRTNMIYWGDASSVKSVRLRCIHEDADFCSGMAFSAQYKNCILTACSFATDHGSFHYILDKDKSGVLKSNKLFFRFEINGGAKAAQISQNGNRFVIHDAAADIYIDIAAAKFRGNDMHCCISDKGIEIVCFEGAEEIHFDTLRDSYLVFTMSVNEKTENTEVSFRNGKLLAHSACAGHELRLELPDRPKKYIDLLKESKVAYTEALKPEKGGD